MRYIKRTHKGEYRGEEFVPGDILQMSDDLANRVILNGKGSPSTEAEYKEQLEAKENPYEGMTLTELKEVDYESLNKDPLVQYATACGLEIGDENKKEIYTLIEAVD